jgi:hypothetical protein
MKYKPDGGFGKGYQCRQGPVMGDGFGKIGKSGLGGAPRSLIKKAGKNPRGSHPHPHGGATKSGGHGVGYATPQKSVKHTFGDMRSRQSAQNPMMVAPKQPSYTFGAKFK